MQQNMHWFWKKNSDFCYCISRRPRRSGICEYFHFGYGKGFPTDVLEKLQRSEDISEDGHHVGIINCLKRFRYYYQDKGEIHFENSPLGSAIIDIHLPLIKKMVRGTYEFIIVRR